MKESFRTNPILATVGLTCVISIAIAAELGRWLCTWCYISPAGTPTSAVALPEAIQALTSIQRETPITPAWRPHDTVTICDGANCIDLTFTGSPLALWILKPGTIPYRDSGRTYKNAQVSQPGTISPEGAFAYRIEIAPIAMWVNSVPWRSPWVRIVGVPRMELPASFASGFAWEAQTSSDAFWWQQGGGGGVCEPLCYYEN